MSFGRMVDALENRGVLVTVGRFRFTRGSSSRLYEFRLVSTLLSTE